MQNPSVYGTVTLCQRTSNLTKDWWSYGLTAKEEKEGYLLHMVSPPLVIAIYFPCYLSLFSMLQDYLGAAWQFLGTMKCHLGKNYLSYNTIVGPPLQQLRNSTYLNNHQPKSATTDINWQLAYRICSDSIPSEFNIHMVMKQGGLEGGQKSASFMGSHSQCHHTQNWTVWLDF
jgi:hypothetical protein